jgi:hypothetical protein
MARPGRLAPISGAGASKWWPWPFSQFPWLSQAMAGAGISVRADTKATAGRILKHLIAFDSDAIKNHIFDILEAISNIVNLSSQPARESALSGGQCQYYNTRNAPRSRYRRAHQDRQPGTPAVRPILVSSQPDFFVVPITTY